MESKGSLYIVATPIGNLGDMTARALEILGRSLLIGAEDTRVARKLLSHYGIATPTVSVHEHSSEKEVMGFLGRLAEGDLAYVSDAGTPGISDPGARIVQLARQMGVQVIPVPGPSAVIAALSVCGFPTTRFTFLGFPPHKKGRTTFFAEIDAMEDTVVLYESKHRIEKALAQLPQNRHCFVARELTKLHESHYMGAPAEILAQITQDSSKGEFVIVLAPKSWNL